MLAPVEARRHLKLILFCYLYGGSKDQTKVTGLMWQEPLAADPSHWACPLEIFNICLSDWHL